LLDVEKRRAVMAKLEAIMLDDGPMVQPVWRALLTFMDKKVQGFKMHPTGYFNANELGVSS
jgi:peptide/nickel transport system substrate-binding protein